MRVVLLGSALLLACSFQGSVPHCVDEPTELASREEAAPNGVVPLELIGETEGVRTAELNWSSSEEVVTSNVAGTNTQLTITLGQFGEMRFVHQRYVQGTAEIVVECSDRVEIDAELVLQTADSALAETIPVRVQQTSRDTLPYVEESIDLAALQGSLRIESTAADSISAKLYLQFGPEGIGGIIEGTAVYVEGDDPDDTVAARFFTLASFGPAG